MYYVKTRADNSGYTNHRVICLVVMGSPFDSEQVFQVSNGYLSIVFEKWTLTKNLTDPDADADTGVTTIAFFLRKVKLKNTIPPLNLCLYICLNEETIGGLC